MRTLVPALCLLLAAALAAPAPARADDARPDVDTPAANAVLRVGGCSGTLIAPDVVLTAAHCTPPVLRTRPADPASCPKLPGHAELARHPGAPHDAWHPTRYPIQVRIGPGPGPGHLRRGGVAYALPRCADIALIRLDAPVPPEIALPLPVITGGPSARALDLALTAGPLRHAGFGRPDGEHPRDAIRRTGRVGYWGRTACALLGLPPMRSHGLRIATGDSGAPLLLRLDGGREAVIGVLWGRGVPDEAACGRPAPRPPADHGAYTPTFRAPVPDTQATDLGAWLTALVPEATLTLE